MRQAMDYAHGLSDNIIVEDVHPDGDVCYLFFSSNGLNMAPDPSGYIDTLVYKNRYEWRSIATPIKKNRHTGRCIFVRDVYMCFYMHGISRRIDTISGLIEELKRLTSDREWKIVTLGISSGGYMSTIAGTALHAYKIYNISGQYDLRTRIPENYDEFISVNPGYDNIVPLVEKYDGEDFSGKSDIFYFCPIGCDHDKMQYEKVKHLSCIKTFLFPDTVHAATVYPFSFPDLLMMKPKKLLRLQRRYDGRLINKNLFLFQTMSARGWLEFIKRTVNTGFSIGRLKDEYDVKKG